MTQSDQPIRVLLADDHTILRQGIRMLLETQDDIVVVGEAVNGQDAVDKTRALVPDVVLMDIAMPILTGLEATRTIKRDMPGVQVVILSMHENEEYVVQILQAGATGYVLKQAADTDLIEAVRVARTGNTYLYPSIATRIISDYLRRVETGEGEDKERSAYAALTGREREILKLIAEGHTNKAIAEQLSLSIKTVENHRANLMGKLHAHDRAELVKFAIRVGLIEP